MSLFSDSALARDCRRRKIPWYCLALTYTGSSSIISDGSGIRACWTPNIWGWICTHPWKQVLWHTRHSITLKCSPHFLPTTTKLVTVSKEYEQSTWWEWTFLSCKERCLPLLEHHRRQQCLQNMGLQMDTLPEPALSSIIASKSNSQLDSSSSQPNSTPSSTSFQNRISKKQAKDVIYMRTPIPVVKKELRKFAAIISSGHHQLRNWWR
jgi:hypothetical protein